MEQEQEQEIQEQQIQEQERQEQQGQKGQQLGWDEITRIKRIFLERGGYVFHRNYRTLTVDVLPATERARILSGIQADFPWIKEENFNKYFSMIIEHEKGFRSRLGKIFGEEFAQKAYTARYVASCAQLNSQKIFLNLDKFLRDYSVLSIVNGHVSWKKIYAPGDTIICGVTHGKLSHLMCAAPSTRIDDRTGQRAAYMDLFDPNGTIEFYEGLYEEVCRAITEETRLQCRPPGPGRPNLNKVVHGRGQCSVWSVLMLDLLDTLDLHDFDEILHKLRTEIPKNVFYSITENYAAWMFKQI